NTATRSCAGSPSACTSPCDSYSGCATYAPTSTGTSPPACTGLPTRPPPTPPTRRRRPSPAGPADTPAAPVGHDTASRPGQRLAQPGNLGEPAGVVGAGDRAGSRPAR